MNTDKDQRLEQLERRFAYQEAAIQAISDQVYSHEQCLSRLEELLRQLVGRVKDLADGQEGHDSADQRPPHY